MRTPRRQVGQIQQHVGGGDRHLLREPAALRVAAVRLQVLVDAVDAFDDDLVLVGQDAQHLAARALVGVVAGDHFHHVVFANVHDSLSFRLGPAMRDVTANRLFIRPPRRPG